MKLTTEEKVERTILQAKLLQFSKNINFGIKLRPVKPETSIIQNPMAWDTGNALWFEIAHGDQEWKGRVDFSPTSGKLQLDFSNSSHDELFLNKSKDNDKYVRNILAELENAGFITYSGARPTKINLTGIFGIAWWKAGTGKEEEQNIVHLIATRYIFGATHFNESEGVQQLSSSGYPLICHNNRYTSLR